MSVRPLKRDDISWVVSELIDLPKQSVMYSDVPSDCRYVEDYFTQLIINGSLYGVVDEEHYAFLLFNILKPWYANRLEAHEMILWVPKDMRGGRSATKLIKAYVDLVKYYSLTQGTIHSIHAGATLDITDAEKTLKLYELCGFKRDGHAGVKITL